jgi:regulator of RNase E activity RraB
VEVIIDTKKNRCLLTYSKIDPVSYDGWGLFFLA